MNPSATGTTATGPASPGQAAGLRAHLLQPTAIGLLIAGLLSAVLGHWFFGQRNDELLAERQERMTISDTVALAELVAAADPATHGELVTDWTREVRHAATARVLQLAGNRLLASNYAEDLADGTPPRRLRREEKALFDLAQTLRVAVETNAQEGVFRKRQLDVQRPAAGRLEVGAPYRQAGEVVGMVQLVRDVERVPIAPSLVGAALLGLGPLLVFLLGARLVPAPAGEGKPWLRFAFAAVLFSLALYSYGRHELARSVELQATFTANLAGYQDTQRERFENLAGRYELSAYAGDRNAPSAWDLDQYERQRAVIGSGGTVIEDALQRQLGETRDDLRGTLWGNWVVGLVVLGFFALGYARRTRETVSEHRNAYGYVSPAIIGMLVLVFFPFTYGIVLSFTDQTIYNINEPITDVLVGLENYAEILGDFKVVQGTDGGWLINYSNFYWTLFITVCWTVFNVTIGVSVGMLLALALNTPGLRFKTLYRVLLILPWAIPNYITALTWKGMFHPQLGQINQMIQMFGGEPVAWFDGVFSSFLTGLATNGWLSFPFMMVVVLGALQSIPGEMYEAATLDGANRWQRFRHVTLPLIKPALVPAVIISVVWTFNMFNVIYLVSEGQPAGANEILITDAYKLAFEQYRYGYSAAYSVVIFMILLVYGVFQARVTKATEGV